MGTWGHGPFENDDACDWLAELEADGLDAVRDALAPSAIDSASDGALAVAAAEVVAAVGGRPSKGLPEEVAAFVATRPDLDGKLVPAAISALRRVAQEDSELHALWSESEDADEWLASVEDLRRRLRSLSSPPA